MGMDIPAVRAALATAASAAQSGDFALTCYPYVPFEGDPPFLYVQLEAVTYDKAMKGGAWELGFTLMLMASTADDISAQTLIDEYLADSGPTSVKAAVEAARGGPGELALGGVADDLHVPGIDSAPRWFDWSDGKKFYGVGLKCRVIGSGD